jgi:hypothetical protein
MGLFIPSWDDVLLNFRKAGNVTALFCNFWHPYTHHDGRYCKHVIRYHYNKLDNYEPRRDPWFDLTRMVEDCVRYYSQWLGYDPQSHQRILSSYSKQHDLVMLD